MERTQYFLFVLPMKPSKVGCFSTISDSPNLKLLCFMKIAHRATYIQWLWREIYFWTFMCFPRSRRNDKVHERIFLMGSSKSAKCHTPFFENRLSILANKGEKVESAIGWFCVSLDNFEFIGYVLVIWILKAKSSHLVTNFHIGILW